MKRTEIKRKTPLSSKTRPNARRKAKKERQTSDKRWRSPTYLAWVRQQPCVVCGSPADSAHHVIGMYGLSGMGLKAPDSFVMPVCDGAGGCHQQIHNDRTLRERQPGFLRDTISRAVREFDGNIKEALMEAWRYIESVESRSDDYDQQ